MRVRDVYDAAKEIEAVAEGGDVAAIKERVGRLLDLLKPDSLLTTGEAAEMLGIRSRNTIKAMIARGDLQAEKHGSRFLIPLDAVQRAQESQATRELRALETLHEQTRALDVPTTEETLVMLDAGQPGMYPWQR